MRLDRGEGGRPYGMHRMLCRAIGFLLFASPCFSSGADTLVLKGSDTLGAKLVPQ